MSPYVPISRRSRRAAKVKEEIAAIRQIVEGEYGRDPHTIAFVCGALFIATPSHEEAHQKQEEILALAAIESAMLDFFTHTGIDLTGADLSQPIPQNDENASQSAIRRFNAGRDTPPTAG